VDVVILDLNLGGRGGLVLLEQLMLLAPPPAVMILSGSVTEHAVQRAVQLGARGYVDKAASLDEVVHAIRQVAQDGVYFSEAPRRLLIDIAARGPGELNSPVTARETEVLARLAAGLMVKEVAEVLNLSKWAVYRIRGDLRRKLDARTDRELVDYAFRIGLADRPAAKPKFGP
jgi:DNA-binding NarL/FixJ family response regulator